MADAATRYTHEFVRRAIPPGAGRLLEVGCGEGALAALLQHDGYRVVALDSDEACVAAANAAGVDGRLATWPNFSDGRFDAVLFTRSLHHVDDLEAGIAAAFASLAPGGRLIVEDFDFDFADSRSLAWFAGLVRTIAAAGVRLEGSDFLSALVDGRRTPLQAWQDAHHHDLHGAAAIEGALRKVFSSVTAEGAAYFFRYVAAAAPGAVELAEALLAHEQELASLGLIVPLGRRFTAEA